MAEDLITELHSITALLHAQANQPNYDVTSTRAAMAQSFVMRINNSNVTSSAATLLVDAIGASAFAECERSMLLHAVSQRALAHVDAGTPQRRIPQGLTTPLNFLCQCDWDDIDNNPSLANIAQIFTARLNLIGLSNANEQTIKSISTAVSMKLWPGGDPDAASSYNVVQTIKRGLRSLQRPSLPYIINYPIVPADLPAVHYQNAYSTDEPVTMTLVGFDARRAQTCSRSSNRMLRPASAPMLGNPGGVQDMGAIMMQVLHQLQVSQNTNVGGGLNLRWCVPGQGTQAPGRGSGVLALEDSRTIPDGSDHPASEVEDPALVAGGGLPAAAGANHVASDMQRAGVLQLAGGSTHHGLRQQLLQGLQQQSMQQAGASMHHGLHMALRAQGAANAVGGSPVVGTAPAVLGAGGGHEARCTFQIPHPN